MSKRALIAAAAVVAAAIPGAQAAAATVVGATRVTVQSALPDYLQVAELMAFDFADVNVALASNGGSASALSQYDAGYAPENGPGETTDGVYPASYDYSYNPAVPGLYHSGSPSAAEYLTVSFAAATTLSKVTIYGRGDCCSSRDLYNVTIYGAGDKVLYKGQLDARTTGNATVTFDAPSSGTPEPAAWALMMGGFGMAGATLRRRRMLGA